MIIFPSIEERLALMDIWVPVIPSARPTFQAPDQNAFAYRLFYGPHDRIVRRRAIAKAEREQREAWDRQFNDFLRGRWDDLYWSL